MLGNQPSGNPHALEGYRTVEDIGEGDRVLLVYLETESKSRRALRKVRLLGEKPRLALFTLDDAAELAEEKDPVT